MQTGRAESAAGRRDGVRAVGRDDVIVLVLFLTTGCVVNAWPAIAAPAGSWVTTKWLAAAGVIVKLLLASEAVRVPSAADKV